MRLIDADATLEQMKGMNMLFSPKNVIDNMPTIDTKQIREEVIDEILKQIKKEEMWLFKVIGSNQNINIAFGGIYAKAEQLKEI